MLYVSIATLKCWNKHQYWNLIRSQLWWDIWVRSHNETLCWSAFISGTQEGKPQSTCDVTSRYRKLLQRIGKEKKPLWSKASFLGSLYAQVRPYCTVYILFDLSLHNLSLSLSRSLFWCNTALSVITSVLIWELSNTDRDCTGRHQLLTNFLFYFFITRRILFWNLNVTI